ncbi:MAG: site-2 protease family protein [Bacteroidetes bacterium QS_8_68_28]|nr:MAG: site-2 protease family protein [Bacteroidetes bacterium QS_8_68_28]
MRRSLKIGSVAGIGIFLHWTFGLLVLGVPAFYLWQGAAPRAALAGTAVVGVVFACVLLHELGHALTARRFDVPTRDITLYPIGGIARLQEIPEEAMKELWIAVAGPAVNVVLAAGLAALTAGLGLTFTPAVLFDPAGLPAGSVPATLLWINAALAGFNMLPAFPMDGGRVLRALLATRFSYARATQLAANVGQAMALGFGLLGLFGGNLILVFIAVFVYLGAQQEARQATLRQTTQGLRVHQAMMTRFQTLAPTDPLGKGADALIAGTDHDFPVVRSGDGAVVGLLQRQRLIEALSERGREGATVGEVAGAENVFTAEAGENLDDVFQQMRGREHQTVPVTEGGRLVGLLTLENVAELMMISSALGEQASASVGSRENESGRERRLQAGNVS